MTERMIVCWTEIPVTNLQASCDFYSAVFDWKMTIVDMEPNKGANFNDEMNAVSGHLYPGKPAEAGTGATIHLVVPDKLEAAMARCETAGGKIVSEPIEIPPGRFAYAFDLDGNSIGLFEPKGM